MLAGSNCRSDIVPSAVPSRFTLDKIEKTISPAQEIYVAYYTDEEDSFTIRVHNFLSSKPQNIEINHDYSELYSHMGIDYYILKNMDQHRAIWFEDSFECNISGNLSIDEIKLMIDSIKKG